MNVLFFMSHAGYARNFEWPMRMLAERGHSLHVGLDSETKENLPGHADLLQALAAEYPAISFDVAPATEVTDWRLVGLGAQAWLDYLRFLEPEFAGATKLRARAGARLPDPVRRFTDAHLARSRARRAARRVLEAAHQGVPLNASVRQYIEQRAPDVVVVTPIADLPSPQAEYVRCAKAMGIPTCLPVASWDNLTTKGLIHDAPDVMTVWSEAQKDEAVSLHGVPAQRIVITGAVAHDHWFDWRPSERREEFCRRLGLDPERPFVLYVGSSPFIAPDEAAFVTRWVKGIRTARDGALADLQVLIRPHPQNPLLGPGAAELNRLHQVVTHPPAGANPTDERSRSTYFDSLYHSAAVMGVNTSALLEGAIVGRPVHTLLAPEYRGAQGETLHFRHLLPENGGMLRVATSIDEQIDQLQRSLASNGDATLDNRDFVARFLRPFGLDEPASPHLVEVIETLAQRRDLSGAPPRRPAPGTGRALALAGVAAVRLGAARRRRSPA